MNFFYFQAVKKPRKFFPSYCVFICCNTSRKAEFAVFYSFIQQAETVFIPVKDLYLVTVAVMKHKHCVTELIEFEILLYNRRQAVYTFSHINICGGNVNLFGGIVSIYFHRPIPIQKNILLFRRQAQLHVLYGI